MKENKNKVVHVRLTENEYDSLIDDASATGVVFSVFLRDRLLSKTDTACEGLSPPVYQLPDKVVSWNRPVLNTEEDRLKKLEMIRMIPLDKIDGSLYSDTEHGPDFVDVFARQDDGEIYHSPEI